MVDILNCVGLASPLKCYAEETVECVEAPAEMAEPEGENTEVVAEVTE